MLAATLSACASARPIPTAVLYHSKTEPLEIEGDYGPPCSVRIVLAGTAHVFSSDLGCYVLRRQIHVPWYDEINP